MHLSLTLTSLSGISSSLGPPISSSSSSFFFFWFLSCFSFSAFFFSSSSWAFFWALRCLFLSFFSSLSERLAREEWRKQRKCTDFLFHIVLFLCQKLRSANATPRVWPSTQTHNLTVCSSPVSACSSLLSSVRGLSWRLR